MRAVIIDDESSAINNLKKIIDSYSIKLDVVGTANGVHEAVELISKAEPDLLFLDIHMPDGSGFDVLENLQYKKYQVIFITSYNQHAIRAFKYSAIDYILKPIDVDELIAAIERVKERVFEFSDFQSVKELISNLQQDRPMKIAIPSSNSTEFVRIDEILHIEASGSYTKFYLAANKKAIASKRIKEFEVLLNDQSFFRVHNSHLVNLNHVKRYYKGQSWMIVLSDGSEVPLSRRRKQFFDDLMKESSKPSKRKQ